MTQMLLLPDPRPLVERLGRDFFREAPERPGVYLMRDTGDLELAITETPEDGWQTFGRRGRGEVYLRAMLVRLLWVAVHPDRGFVGLPTGWAQGRLEDCTIIDSGLKAEEVSAFVGKLLAGEADEFGEWMIAQLGTCPFDRTAVTEDLDALKKMIAAVLRQSNADVQGSNVNPAAFANEAWRAS